MRSASMPVALFWEAILSCRWPEIGESAAASEYKRKRGSPKAAPFHGPGIPGPYGIQGSTSPDEHRYGDAYRLSGWTVSGQGVGGVGDRLDNQRAAGRQGLRRELVADDHHRSGVLRRPRQGYRRAGGQRGH